MLNLLESLSNSFDFALSPSQIKAANEIGSFLESEEKCFILTGSAGTGKTTIVGGITKYLNHQT